MAKAQVVVAVAFVKCASANISSNTGHPGIIINELAHLHMR